MFFRKSKKREESDDKDLIRLFKETGELSYLGELYQRYMHLVFGVSMKYLKDEEESKDMTMQVFEKLIHRLQQHNVENFKSWLHVLVKNQCLMTLRSKKYKTEQGIIKFISEDDMETDLFLHPPTEDGKEEDFVKMEEGIVNLSPEQKRCVELFYLEQKCYKEIVQITGYDLAKVKSYIQNGKRNLKIYMEKRE